MKYDKDYSDVRSEKLLKVIMLKNIANELALQNELKLIELQHIAVRDNVPETLTALHSFSSVSR